MLASLSNTSFADDLVLWDLAKNDLPASPQLDAVQKVNGVVRLRDGAAFTVPAEAFPDQKNFVYVFHCVHFVGGDVPEKALTEMAGRYPFDAVVFNNGLHSLAWTPDRVPDQVVQDRMRKLARCFKNGSPQAKLFYLTTTPHTAARPAPDKPVTGLGDKNDIVIRLNTLSTQIMKEEGIELIDVYPILSARLELAAGDNFHWQGPAYQIISQEIARHVLPALKARNP